MFSKTRFLFLGLALCSSAVLAQVEPQYQKDAEGAKDPALLKRVEGSIILRATTKKFDAQQIPLERVVFDYETQKFKDWKRLKVEGTRHTVFYRLPKDATTLETLRSYQNELKEAGFEVLHEGYSGGTAGGESNTLDNGYGRFLDQAYENEKDYDLQQYTMPGAEDFRFTALKKAGENGAGDIYVTIFCCAVTDSWKAPEKGILPDTVLARVDMIETKALQSRMVEVKAEEMEKLINSTGRVALYGIYFDFNKDTLTKNSDTALLEIQKLMQADTKLKVLVVGHTDNVGDFELNRDLSNRRAAAVVKALVERYGLAKDRLLAFGCSSASPAAPNSNDEGRAKNRRVELVRLN